MMKYVAFLRGINVGGNSKVEMSRLKRVFSSLDYKNVKTYINSGNVIFSTDMHRAHITDTVEDAIKHEFDISIPVVIRSCEEIEKIIRGVPEIWMNDTEQKTDVLFLWEEIDSKEVLEKLIIKPQIDNVLYIQGAIIWNVKRKNIGRSGLLKIVGTQLYKKITVRNINTVRKLERLMTLE